MLLMMMTIRFARRSCDFSKRPVRGPRIRHKRRVFDDATRQRTGLPIIFLTGHGDIPMSVRAMKAGAVDFLTKPVQREALLCAGRTALRQDATNRFHQDHVNSLQARSGALTSRERAVLSLVVQGMLNKQIAAALGIAERTVKAHRAQVMAKMQVESLAELVRIADQLEIRDV